MFWSETPVPERTELSSRPEGRAGGGVTLSPGRFGKAAGRLAGYGIATVGLTMLLLRPRSRASRTGGGVFLGAGLLVALVKTMLSVGSVAGTKVATATATPPPAATPAPVAAPAKPAPAATPVAKLKPATGGQAVAKSGARPPAGSPPTGKARTLATAQATKKPAPAVAAPPSLVAKPADAVTKVSGKTTASQPAATPVASAPPVPATAAEILGPEFADKSAGYAARFPAGWAVQSLTGRGSWVAAAGDGKSTSIAIGFMSDGGKATLNKRNLELLAEKLKAQPGTEVQGSGFGTLAGRPCMWHKLSLRDSRPSGPAEGGAARCSAVQYVAPLGDGRALKVRVVARQDRFAEWAPRMKQSIDTLKVLPPPAGKQVASGD